MERVLFCQVQPRSGRRPFDTRRKMATRGKTEHLPMARGFSIQQANRKLMSGCCNPLIIDKLALV